MNENEPFLLSSVLAPLSFSGEDSVAFSSTDSVSLSIMPFVKISSDSSADNGSNALVKLLKASCTFIFFEGHFPLKIYIN